MNEAAYTLGKTPLRWLGYTPALASNGFLDFSGARRVSRLHIFDEIHPPGAPT
jgi:hypothetical protein